MSIHRMRSRGEEEGLVVHLLLCLDDVVVLIYAEPGASFSHNSSFVVAILAQVNESDAMTTNEDRAGASIAGDLRVGAGVVEELLNAHFVECEAALACNFALLVLLLGLHPVPPELLEFASDGIVHGRRRALVRPSCEEVVRLPGHVELEDDLDKLAIGCHRFGSDVLLDVFAMVGKGLLRNIQSFFATKVVLHSVELDEEVVCVVVQRVLAVSRMSPHHGRSLVACSCGPGRTQHCLP
mmetsp:Transcript_33967/g.90044  ORF Transcript_33967/g.90044 Transcript_33967/m.90044 type:complete len:239 (+) Transcript_33967:102-818(+)